MFCEAKPGAYCDLFYIIEYQSWYTPLEPCPKPTTYSDYFFALNNHIKLLKKEKKMKKVYQTIFGKPNGNCFQACIASMLECELNDIPNFMKDGPDHFKHNLKEWENKMPFKLFDIKFEDQETKEYYIKNYILIATIDKMYGNDRTHSVIMKDSKIIHDPMPVNKRGDMKITDPIFYTIFAPKEPHKYFDLKEK